MKNLILISVVCLLGLASCDTCSTCNYTNDLGEAKSAQSCDGDAIELLEQDLNDQWGIYGPVTCEENMDE